MHPPLKVHPDASMRLHHSISPPPLRPRVDCNFRSGPLSLSLMRTAFKEWAIVVDALGRGEQIIILRKGGISEGRGTDLKPTPAEWLSHAAQFDKFNTPASYGVLGKDNIKTGSLTGETGSSPKDVATSQSGFSLTLSCKVKEGVATWLVSVERASEVGINVGVFKADMKQKRRIFGFTIKKLATGDKDLLGKRKDEVNFAMV